ncbi:MAG: LemA family protein [Lautropia sp.]|nr:LemA family protein [Lautropia sp.]
MATLSLKGRCVRLLSVGMVAVWLSGCGYNDIQRADEATKQGWAEVLNQYQRRADLIPNLVNTVKGYAEHEKEVLTRVTDARSRVGQIQAQVNPADPASLKQFENAQAEMSSALSRLLVVAENYPQLQANQNFSELQAELAGTENRITVARKRYIQTLNDYNVLVREFPVNLTAKVFGYDVKPQFTVENEQAISKPPAVDFGGAKAPAGSTQPAPAGGTAN